MTNNQIDPETYTINVKRNIANSMIPDKVALRDLDTKTFEVQNVKPNTSATTGILVDPSTNKEVAITLENIATYGMQSGSSIRELSRAIIERVSVADSGELSQGISDILTLTEGIDVSKLGNKKPTFLSKLFNITGVKNVSKHVTEKYTTVSKQIDNLSDVVVSGLERMGGESLWLQENYNANVDNLRYLEQAIANLQAVCETHTKSLQEMKETDFDVVEFDKLELMVNAMERQLDTLVRLMAVVKTNLPQLKLMSDNNLKLSDKFNSVLNVTIPMWESQLSCYLISDQQTRDAELSHRINKHTNLLLKQNNKMVTDNIIQSTKADSEGIVEVETLREITNNLVTTMKNVIELNDENRNNRLKLHKELRELDDKLRDEMRGIQTTIDNKRRTK